MQLSYRGRYYTPTTTEIATTEHTFEGQFLGRSKTCTVSYRSSTSGETIPLSYRGRLYIGAR